HGIMGGRAEAGELRLVIDESPIAIGVAAVDVDGPVPADHKDLIAAKPADTGGEGATRIGHPSRVRRSEVGAVPGGVEVIDMPAVGADRVSVAVAGGADARVIAAEVIPGKRGI